MTRALSNTRVLALSLVGAMAVVGCSKTDQSSSDTAASARSATAARSATTGTLEPRIALDAEGMKKLAANYKFGQDRNPVSTTKPLMTGKNAGVRKADEPKMTIATAEPGEQPAEGQIIAIIKSNKAYDGLGIGKGISYIWRDKRGSTDARYWEVFMISTEPFNVTRLWRGSEPLSTGDPMEPRLVYNDSMSPRASKSPPEPMVAYGLCIDDPNLCETGHCGYNNQ